MYIISPIYTNYYVLIYKGMSQLYAGVNPEFGKGGCTLLKRLKTKK